MEFKIEEVKRWKIVGEEEEFKSEKEAELYIKTEISKEELIKALDRKNYNYDGKETFFETIQNIPCEVAEYIKNYVKFHKETD
jgi:hypothetical protein